MNTDPRRNGPPRILIAEDSATQAQNLRHLLEAHGYEVGVAGDGRRALAMASQSRPALIVSDVVMPDMDGYELCRRVKDNPDLRDIPVILVTTMSDPGDVIRGLECGADNFIAKPYDQRYLLDRVRYALVNRELRRAAETSMGLEVYFNNRKHFITADRLQILNLLLSTYEAAIQRNSDLSQAQQELRGINTVLSEANHRLEQEVWERKLAQAQRDRFFTLPLDMLCVAGADGYFKNLNPAFSQTLGYTTAELLARPFLDFIHPDDRAATHAAQQKAGSDGAMHEFENRYRCKDGSWKWLSWRFQSFPSEGLLYAAARDATESKRMLQELHERELEARAANQSKSMFLAAMSHEIRTPLIGVLGMLEVLGRSKLDPEQRRQFSIAHQSAHSLLEIIGDILDYSKIEAGKVELATETVAVRDLVSRVVATFSANAQSRGLRLTQVVDAGVAAAHVADGVRLAQILSNFVGNAIKFTERGSVTVAVRMMEDTADGQRLGFTVSDTGIGMTPAQLDRLFQAFTQAEAGTTRRFGGTGLGLVICQRLAELMGGTVRAESKPAQGTAMTLELCLPVGDPKSIVAAQAAEDQPIVTRPRPTREQAEREGSLLLLAEDHPFNREVLTGQLNLAGFFVDTAEDGIRALEKFGATRYGLVLTDLHMPGLDGYQLTAAIREFEAANGRPRTPIIALTADVVLGHVERCLASGMDDYLSKPVTIRQLVEKLRRWLPQVG